LLWDYAKEIGLSPIQIQILIFIKYHAEAQCQVSSLAREFNVSKPTISDAIKVLHQKKLIKKQPSVADKRAYHIRLSQQGEQLVAQTEHFAQPIQTILEEISTREQTQFFHTLTRLINGLQKADVISVQRSCYACRYYEPAKELPYCKLFQKTLFAQDIRLDCPEFVEKSNPIPI
jgi:DNA-binding MarR family transcriptional regulator